MRKKMYEKPSIKVLGMEAEPVMASYSSYNPGGDPGDGGIDIEEGMPGDDGTDLEKEYGNKYGVKSHSVWN